jgi:hypothetical protein
MFFPFIVQAEHADCRISLLIGTRCRSTEPDNGLDESHALARIHCQGKRFGPRS